MRRHLHLPCLALVLAGCGSKNSLVGTWSGSCFSPLLEAPYPLDMAVEEDDRDGINGNAAINITGLTLAAPTTSFIGITGERQKRDILLDLRSDNDPAQNTAEDAALMVVMTMELRQSEDALEGLCELSSLGSTVPLAAYLERTSEKPEDLEFTMTLPDTGTPY